MPLQNPEGGMAVKKKAAKQKPAQKAAAKTSKARGKKARVAVLMGSKSDWPSMEAAVEVLKGMGVGCDVRVISAHRTPERHHKFVTGAEAAGIELFICGAGFAAHLAGVTAAITPLPVLGVPLDSSALNGMDALLATVQMPGGIPVATFGIGKSGAKNAGLFAAAMLAGSDSSVRKALDAYRKKQTASVPERPF
ncbi:MAG: 5-(carboxyamino)imidazole ribonucleotide mutase [Myxococcota bacterium]